LAKNLYRLSALGGNVDFDVVNNGHRFSKKKNPQRRVIGIIALTNRGGIGNVVHSKSFMKKPGLKPGINRYEPSRYDPRR